MGSHQKQQQNLDSGSETAHTFKEDGSHQEKQSQSLQHVGANQAESDHDDDDDSNPNPNLVTWDSPGDPENPLNWTSAKRWITVAVVSYMTFLACV